MLTGNALKLITQAVYFILIARSLGPGEYGAFIGVTAATGVLAPFVGLGSTNLMIRAVATYRGNFSVCWGNGLLVTSVSAVLAITLMLSGATFILTHITYTVVLAVTIADLLFQRVTDLCSFAFGAVDKFHCTAQITVLTSVLRLAGLAILLFAVPHPTLLQWVLVYTTTAALVALISCTWVMVSLDGPSISLPLVRLHLIEGFYFSTGQSSQSIYNDLDKAMLAQLCTFSATGIYGAAYRIIDVSLVPIRSLVSASYPGLFRAGATGMAASLTYVHRLMMRALAYATFASASLLLMAPLLPAMLGRNYTDTVEALRWLALLPVLKALQFFLADALTGAGFQGTRTLLQCLTAVLNVGANLWLLPRYSWRGAAWSSLGCDAFLSLGLYLAITYFLCRERERIATTSAIMPTLSCFAKHEETL